MTSPKTRIPITDLIYYLIIGIISTIFFQQVFVVNVGGSFKIYELFALFLFAVFVFIDRPRIYGNLSAILFIFFMVLTTFGTVSYLISGLPYDYYRRFPDALNSLRTNIIIAPILLLLYYWFTWIVINYIISSKKVFINRQKILKLFIFIATLVSLYNFYAFVFVKFLHFPDLIPSFLDYRNSPTYRTGRFGGFSDEPGTYIILQTWVVYYLILEKIKVNHNRLITIINTISWLMTLSSLLVPGIIILIIFFFINNKKARLKIIFSSCIAILCIGAIINRSGIKSQVEYIAKEKLENYIYGADHTLDSGSYRNFTTRLGFRLFKDNPIFGTGPGSSCFFIWQYENKMGIKTWGERITETTYPQNLYSKICGEMGICGILIFAIFFFCLLKDEIKFCKRSPFIFTSLAGTIFMIFAYATTYPETSIFLWINIALSCNTLYHLKHVSQERSFKYLQSE